MRRLRKWFKNRWRVLAIILILLVVVSRFGGSKSAKKTNQYTVTRQDVAETLTLSGKIDADQKAVLHFQTSGRLVWLGVKPGDKVSAYQTVASLDQRDVQKNLEKKLNSYLKTRWDFEQTQDDNENKIITDTIKRVLEKSQFDLNNAVLDVELQNLAVEFSNLVTPISGIVTRVTPSVAGLNVTPQTAEIEVVNPNSVYLSVLADQTEVTKLTEGMKADIVLDAYPSEHVESTIVTIGFAPKPDETSTVYEEKLKLATSADTYHYRLGMTADASFVIKEVPQVLAIPSSLISKEGDVSFVTKLVRGKQEKTKVLLGQEFDTMVEVTSGLKEGDIIYD